MKSSMFGLRLSQFGKIQSFDFLKIVLEISWIDMI